MQTRQASKPVNGSGGSAKRPTGFWEPLNLWWRNFHAEQGKKPSQAHLERWYEENSGQVWSDGDRPGLDVTLQHAQTLRVRDDARKHFKGHKTRTKRAARSCQHGLQDLGADRDSSIIDQNQTGSPSGSKSPIQRSPALKKRVKSSSRPSRRRSGAAVDDQRCTGDGSGDNAATRQGNGKEEAKTRGDVQSAELPTIAQAASFEPAAPKPAVPAASHGNTCTAGAQQESITRHNDATSAQLTRNLFKTFQPATVVVNPAELASVCGLDTDAHTAAHGVGSRQPDGTTATKQAPVSLTAHTGRTCGACTLGPCLSTKSGAGGVLVSSATWPSITAAVLPAGGACEQLPLRILNSNGGLGLKCSNPTRYNAGEASDAENVPLLHRRELIAGSGAQLLYGTASTEQRQLGCVLGLRPPAPYVYINEQPQHQQQGAMQQQAALTEYKPAGCSANPSALPPLYPCPSVQQEQKLNIQALQSEADANQAKAQAVQAKMELALRGVTSAPLRLGNALAQIPQTSVGRPQASGASSEGKSSQAFGSSPLGPAPVELLMPLDIGNGGTGRALSLDTTSDLSAQAKVGVRTSNRSMSTGSSAGSSLSGTSGARCSSVGTNGGWFSPAWGIDPAAQLPYDSYGPSYIYHHAYGTSPFYGTYGADWNGVTTPGGCSAYYQPYCMPVPDQHLSPWNMPVPYGYTPGMPMAAPHTHLAEPLSQLPLQQQNRGQQAAQAANGGAVPTRTQEQQMQRMGQQPWSKQQPCQLQRGQPSFQSAYGAPAMAARHIMPSAAIPGVCIVAPSASVPAAPPSRVGSPPPPPPPPPTALNVQVFPNPNAYCRLPHHEYGAIQDKELDTLYHSQIASSHELTPFMTPEADMAPELELAWEMLANSPNASPGPRLASACVTATAQWTGHAAQFATATMWPLDDPAEGNASPTDAGEAWTKTACKLEDRELLSLAAEIDQYLLRQCPAVPPLPQP